MFQLLTSLWGAPFIGGDSGTSFHCFVSRRLFGVVQLVGVWYR